MRTCRKSFCSATRTRGGLQVAGGVLVGFLSLLILLAPTVASADGQFLKVNDPARVGHVRLILDKSQTLRTARPFAEAMIANPGIADAVPLTDQSIYIIGKRIGVTRLTLIDDAKRLLGVYEVEVSYDVNGLREELNRSIHGGNFELRTASGRILLGGSVPDAVALSKAVEITEQYTGNCSPGEIRGTPAAADKDQPNRYEAAPGPSEGAPPGAVKCYVNLLKVRAPQQVMLEVRFVEAVRTAARDLGLAWDARSKRFRGLSGTIPVPHDGEKFADILTGASAVMGFPSGSVPFGTFLARVLDNGTKADLIIQALESRGLARRLAEPNLVALSGDTASFLAGGEFPFPVPQTSGDGGTSSVITVEFKKFGIGLAFTPTVLADGQINLKIEPEVSDIDPSNSIFVGGGITVPGLVVRRASTTVELRDGQSFAIAGLLETKHTKDNNQLPWLGEVPVLGALFRSASYEKRESDLVIIVTPRLVRPAVPGQKLATPLDQTVPANDRDFFLRGKHEIPKHFPAPYGHILELNGWVTSVAEAPYAPYK